ncbi:MAG: hypothetical protein ACM3WU_11160 [Bacillota bacterium]
MKTGVDIGGSLTKIVTVSDSGRQYCLLEHTDAAGVAEILPREGEIYVTGCGAKEVVRRLGRHAHIAEELHSFCAGARQLVFEQGHGSDPFVLVSMGTGTSVFHVSPTSGTRAAGTGVGGGTITGLGNLLLSTKDFATIMEMASRGRRQRVDLMVSDLYPDAADSPVLSALTAANFGRASAGFSGCGGPGTAKTESPADPESPANPENPADPENPEDPEDIASAIVQMVVETVAVLSIQVARTYNTRSIVVGGSPSSHPLTRKRFLEIGDHLGHEFAFLEHGAFCGALGAILLSR